MSNNGILGAEASLRAGEILTSVDGVGLVGTMGPYDLGKLILGPPGSQVQVLMFT